MNKSLKILHLEDNSADAELVERELKKGGIGDGIVLVSNREEFVNALRDFFPDIILSDHSLPSFDSHEALMIVKEMGIQVPFILVTATVSEEYAVNIIKEGATDYILKDRLQRLPNAIWGAIDKYNLRIERKQADGLLRASERKYKLLFESNPMPMWMESSITGDIIAVNTAAINHYGYRQDEFLKMKAEQLWVENKKIQHTGEEKTDDAGTWEHKKKDGAVITVEIISHSIIYENMPVKLVLANDITLKLKAEKELAEERKLQQKLITDTSIKVQEREREEIGRELHDNINQLLAAAKLYLDYAIKKDNLHSDRLEKSRENIILAIDEIRKLSRTLVAPSLGDITLTEALTELIDNINQVTPLYAELNTEKYTGESIDKNIELMFYRIVQEQINNIIKHAHAKNVSITLSTTARHTVLKIKDDGVGFDTSKTAGGIGLKNINNRVSYYDGITRIISSPGEGCTLEISVPLTKNSYAEV